MSTTSTILLVEDNEDDEILTLRALKKNHIANEVVVTRDGAAALDYLFGRGAWASRDASAAPQLVLLDLNLPKVSGLGVLKELRADPRLRAMPVVVLTSSKEDEDVIESYQPGANSYVRKPVDFTQFTEAVRTLGLYWLVINHVPGKP